MCMRDNIVKSDTRRISNAVRIGGRYKFAVANCITICYNIANKIGVDMLAKLLGSQVRAAILRVLFTEERCEVHLRELARRTGFSAPCLMREAKMLVGEAIIIEDKRENRSYYRANENCPLCSALMELVAKTSSGEAIIARQLWKPTASTSPSPKAKSSPASSKCTRN